MRGTLLVAVLLIIGASMAGCGEAIIPCTSNEECTFEFGWDNVGGPWDSYSMVCNLDVSPLVKCNELMATIPEDMLVLPPMVICAMMFGEVADHGTCEVSEEPA